MNRRQKKVKLLLEELAEVDEQLKHMAGFVKSLVGTEEPIVLDIYNEDMTVIIEDDTLGVMPNKAVERASFGCYISQDVMLRTFAILRNELVKERLYIQKQLKALKI